MSSSNQFSGVRVKSLLARGGMGEIWLADDGAQHDVVLKLVRSEFAHDARIKNRFMREIEVTSRLDHPHVVRHRAHGQVRGREVLMMEHIPGITLARLARARVPMGSALCIAHDIASALAYVHVMTDADGAPLDVVHGDVSPQNIVIDDAGAAHLIDFGSVTTRKTLEEPRSVFGKRCYVSPEQMRGDVVDGSSDQYSLGVILWELLAGRELFCDETRTETSMPSAASDIDLPRVVETTLARMLAFDKRARFPSMTTGARMLNSIAGEVSRARHWLSSTVCRRLRMNRGAMNHVTHPVAV
jgi:serine/threonine protein kinase